MLTGGLAIGVVLAVGAAVGSFLNVIIIRTKTGTGWLSGRSQCPHCGQTLAWFELIPLLSFAVLRGRCRKCHQVLSWQYPIVELLTAATFWLTAAQFGWTWTLLAAWAVTATMILIAVYDARWALIPDSFTLALALAALAFGLLVDFPWIDRLLGTAAGAAFFGLQFLLSRRRWVGSGDILLGGALGLLLGWRMLGLGLMLAYLVGAMAAAGLILSRRASHRSSVAFGPYLVVGGFAAWLYGPVLIDWYFNHAIFR